MFYSNSIRLTAFFSNFSTIPQKDKPALFYKNKNPQITKQRQKNFNDKKSKQTLSL